MRNTRFILLVFLCFGTVAAQDPQPGADGLGDSTFPQYGNGGYDVQHYTLDLTWDNETGEIVGMARIDARAIQDLSAFNLDLHGMTVDSIVLKDEAVEFVREDLELTIIPAEFLPQDESFSVVVTYHGLPDPIVAGFEGWFTTANGVHVANEPRGASTWFPANDHPIDKATYTFRITVPQPYIAAANGLLQQEIDNGDTTTFVWEASDPMASYLSAVYIGDFVVQSEAGPGGLPIRNYFPPDDAEQFAEQVAVTSQMIEFYSERFGPYPFETYGIAVVPAFSGALENQTLSLFSPGLLNDAVIAHELAHQWFGNSISPASWQDIWLNEGFATFAAELWLEHIDSDELSMGSYDMASRFSPPGRPGQNIFRRSVYIRGGWTLQALRARVGDEVMFDILQTYHQRFAGGVASTDDFIAVAEQVSGDDLGEFFQGWLFDATPPPVPELGLGVDE